MEREPQPVPGTMDEGVAVPGCGKDAPRGAVDLLAGHAGSHCLERGLIRGEDRLVRTGELGRWLAHVSGAGHVGVIPFQRAAPVANDRIAGSNHAVAGGLVRRRPMWAAADVTENRL